MTSFFTGRNKGGKKLEGLERLKNLESKNNNYSFNLLFLSFCFQRKREQ